MASLLGLSVVASAEGSGSMSNTTLPFTFGERLGLVFIGQSASLSAIAVLGLLSFVAINAIRNIVHPPLGPWHFVRTHVDVYFLSLLISDLIQAIGGIMDVRWAADAAVQEGAYCTAQGALKQMGDCGVALASLAIAVHTFAVLFYRWSPPNSFLLSTIVVSVIWTFILLLVVLGYALHSRSPDIPGAYYGNTQYWCWITSAYPIQRIILEYAWMWMTALINILLYFPLFLKLRGNLLVRTDGWFKWKWRWGRRDGDDAWLSTVTVGGSIVSEDTRMRDSTTVAKQMLWYPIAYTFLVLPIAIVRFLAFSGHNVPFPGTAFAGIIFGSSGLVNVILFTFTRPSLLPTRHRHPSRSFSGSSPGSGGEGLKGMRRASVITFASSPPPPQPPTLLLSPVRSHLALWGSPSPINEQITGGSGSSRGSFERRGSEEVKRVGSFDERPRMEKRDDHEIVSIERSVDGEM